MDKIKVLIVEDELIIATDLKDILQGANYEVVDMCKSYEAALKSLEANMPDILLLDIQIRGEKDGVDLANEIHQNYKIPFVYISSHTDRATLDRAKETLPYGFLVKPFEDDDVLVAVEIALLNFAKEQNASQPPEHSDFVINNSLFIRQKNLSVKVNYDDILYAAADANYCTVFTKDQKYVLRSTLKELEGKLTDNRFFRSHKSYLINLTKVTAINSDVLYIEDHKLPVGREQLAWLSNQINKI